MRNTLLLAGLLCVTVQAAPANSTVLQVLADQVFVLASMEKAGDWNMDDHVCVTREKEKIACGIVVQTTPRAAKVKLNVQSKVVKVGDSVVAEDNDRTPSSIDSTSSISVDPSGGPKYNILLGVKQNLNAAIPFVHIQIISNNHISLGVQIDKVAIKIPDTLNTVSAIGASFNANVYGEGPFKGFWFQGGTGFHILPSTSTGIATTSYAPSFVGLLGWRNKWALGLNIGIGLGVQYFLLPAGITTEFTFSALQPILSMDIGFNL